MLKFRKLLCGLIGVIIASSTACSAPSGKAEPTVAVPQVIQEMTVTQPPRTLALVSTKPPKTQMTKPPSTKPQVTKVPLTKPSSSPSAGEIPKDSNYILNKNTNKFHYPDCASVKLMNESNKRYFEGTSQEAMDEGYIPCKICRP